MEFRKPRMEDLKVLLEIQNEDSKTTWDENALKTEIQWDHPASAVLILEKIAVGFIFIRSVGEDWEITSMAVKKAFRNRGHGHALVNQVIEKGRKNNVPRLLLEVSQKNTKALNLYKHLGFTPGRVRPGYYSDGSDALEMSLTIAFP